ncbi:MAG: sel1 repeat family protein [Opitutales bacterium]|nr:sel1 repeat family protein [Opitutales bacterium]
MKLPEIEIEKLQRDAETGSTQALIALGDYWCSDDMNFAPNEEKAFSYYHDAYEKGDPDAAHNLSICYEHGIGVPADEERSYAYLREAADGGDANAKWKLATKFAEGTKYTPQDKELAQKLFIEAAETDMDYMTEIADYYMDVDEENFPIDLEIAESWIRKAFAAGEKIFSIQGLLKLAKIYEAGEIVTKNFGKAISLYREITEIEQEAPRIKGISRGEAAFILGKIYENGSGVPADNCEAVKYFHIATALGNKDARRRLGEILFFGQLGHSKKPEEGIKYLEETDNASDFRNDFIEYYRRLAEGGDAEAQFRLSELLYSVVGSRKSTRKTDKIRLLESNIYASSESAKWARRAAEQGHAEAQMKLFSRLLYAAPREALLWREKAVENNHSDAIFSLANSVQFGNKELGIQKNIRHAISLYEKNLQIDKDARDYCYGALADCHAELGEWEKAAEYWILDCENEAQQQAKHSYRSYFSTPFFHLATACYAKGRGVPKDKNFAARLLQIACYASNGCPWEARMKFADWLWRGIGIPADKEKAVALYRREADLEPYAEFRLGWAYFVGQGVEKRDMLHALRLFQKSATHYWDRLKRRIRSLFRKGS